ncbi:MAG: ribonuclease R [Eubacteriales bacterium]|nr:ribonuclease R [Eubacteriales bacterium]
MKRRYKPQKTKKKLPLAEGVLSCASNGNFGFVSTGDGKMDIYVDHTMMGGANHGDKVLVRPTTKKHHGKNIEGRIMKVLERSLETTTAVVFADFGGVLAARADDPRFYPVIHISQLSGNKAQKGDRILVEFTGFDSYGQPDAEIIKNLGNADSIKSRIDSIIYTHGIKTDFSPETLAESENITESISENEINSRLDLRNEKVITIDGDDAKDFDDAISIRKLAGGFYKLGVHIADVSHYVTPDCAIDCEAFERGTSVYLADRVIPMLPEHLSNGVCSLVPNEDRLTLSCIMTVSPSGNVKDYRIEKSVIRSKHRMTYTNVDKILNGDSALKKEYKDILTQLANMNTLADILTEKRKKRGSIDFDLPEAKVSIDKNYKVGEVVARERLKSHKIIEEFMLLANETVAEHAVRHALPLIFRTHAEPDSEKLENLSIFLHHFGLSLPDISTEITPKHLQALLDKIKDEPYAKVISRNMLRSMMKAEYRPENDGHFGLAADFYCHFTSPIRRYPDLMVHRILSMKAKRQDTNKMTEVIKEASIQSTETERAAEECERDVDTLLKVLYISEHIGNEFKAVITSLTEYGIYAELENTIEGMIRLESIGGDYYIYDEKAAVTKGRRTGKSFKVGDSVDIVVTGADTNLLRVDFMLKKDYYHKGREKNAI